MWARRIGEHHHHLPRLLNQMGFLFAELQDPETALRWDLNAVDASRSAAQPAYEMERYSLINVATDYLRSGDLDSARQTVSKFESLSRGGDYVRFRYSNRHLLLMAELELASGNFDSVLSYTGAAIQNASRRGMRKYVAFGRLLSGGALLGLERPEAAILELRSAVEVADRIGHGSLRWKLRRELGYAGDDAAAVEATAIIDSVRESLAGSPLLPHFAPHGLESHTTAAQDSSVGLTPREVEVLRLMAKGLKNREIAEALFISERTVTTHVTNILAKIGCPNRAGAAAFAVRQGILAT